MHRLQSQKGFTLVEVAVIAPIIILLIGAFIALTINLAGEALSSHATDKISYDVQNTLNRIEEDVKISRAFLAENNISVSSSGQGYGDQASSGSTVNFTNINNPSGSFASIIIEGIATTQRPLTPASNVVYLADAPNDCSDSNQYKSNTPMPINIVYFVDANNTLWRRVIIDPAHTSGSAVCGDPAWNLATCKPGYSAGSRPHCKANDEKLIEGVSANDFQFSYFNSPGSSSPNLAAKDAGTNAEGRNQALLETNTIKITIQSNQTVAGRDISQSGSVLATRL